MNKISKHIKTTNNAEMSSSVEKDIEEFIEIIGSQLPHNNMQSKGDIALRSSIPDSENNVLSTHASVQWAIVGDNVFTACGRTSNKLSSGVYRIQENSRGDLLLSLIDMVNDELLVLPSYKNNHILDSIKKFWDSKVFFSKRRQVYKRGILFYGPPGVGKTSALTLLMQDIIQRNGVIFLMTNPITVSKTLTIFRRIEPDRPLIILMEDIDELAKIWGESELLSILDGENQINNVLYLATTNYPERLDPRLINRPSRFDEIIKINLPSREDRLFYLRSKLFPDELETININTWLQDTEDFSIAHLKELIISVFCLQANYDSTLRRLKTMIKSKHSTKTSLEIGFRD